MARTYLLAAETIGPNTARLFERILADDVGGPLQLIPQAELDRVKASFVDPVGVTAQADWFTVSNDTVNGAIVLTAIPEPSTYGAIFVATGRIRFSETV